ncbi:MAG: alpha-L-fucosidase [Bacteroidales bacterium]|nr:alpha-L-fucosidase [Bacteroidales bacterium]
MRKRALIATVSFLLAGTCLEAQYVPPVEEDVKARIAEWQDLKFGMFIHWGPYSQWGIVESWSICPEDVSWQYNSRDKEMPYFEYLEKYEHLKDTFNPVKFDPGKWADAAKYAGMKYVVFTTKHHDGFCMFDTHQTDYKVTDEGCAFHTDPRANIAKELFDAYRARGIKAGAYFSFPDWHSDDFWWRRFPPKSRRINYNPHTFPEKWAAYQDYVASQLDELTSGEYGDLYLMWYDMPVTDEGRTVEYDWERFATIVRGNQPGMIMVARGQRTVYENYQTPEQEIPEKALDFPWESCVTMSQGWSFRRDPVYKSTATLLAMLVRIVSRGGNFLLNVGPSPEGTLDDTAYERLREIGDWMKVNSEGIYATKAVEPYQDGQVHYTAKGDYVYAFYIPENADSESLPSEIHLTAFVPVSSRAVSLLGAKGTLKWKKAAEGGSVVTIPEQLRKSPPCDHIWCLKIKVN